MSIPYKISGSRSSAILGLSSYQTIVEVWLNLCEENNPGFCEKHNYKKPDFQTNNSIIWGSAFEDEIIKAVSKVKNIKLTDREKSFIKDEFLSCHVDAICGDILIENKTTSEFYYKDHFGEPETDQIPIEYQCQIQHNLYVTGLQSCLMPVLVFPKRPDDYVNNGVDIDKIDKSKWMEVFVEMGCLKFYQVNANPDLQKKLIAHYTDFWQNNVLKQIPPEPRDISDIKLLYRDPIGTVIASEHVTRMVKELRDIQSELGDGGSLKKRVDQLKTEIMKFIVDSEKTKDDDSQDKYILRDDTGAKLAMYYKDKKGTYIFR